MGKVGHGKGTRIMRKVSLVVLGAVVGAGIVSIGSNPQYLMGGAARAAASDTYRNLNLFGDVFEKIRTEMRGDMSGLKGELERMIAALPCRGCPDGTHARAR